MAYNPKWIIKGNLGINRYRSYYWWEVTLYQTRRFWFKHEVSYIKDTSTSLAKAKLDANKFVCKTTGISNYQFW